ncbi:MAG: xanthine dehydrogenase family protein subunit M [Elusimicrobia bacterium]|nr:xanthine dehydrogenase family protein subunit M [Elusimicrobiota bacterium]
MRGDAASMTLLRAKSAADALRLRARNPAALPLAGGTDLMVHWNAGLLNGRTVLDISAVKDWRRIKVGKDGAEVGALATHAALLRQPAVVAGWPLLTAACGLVGGPQIQARGTLGGNIANASPAGDTFPPLAVYEARVRVASSAGSRELAFSEVFTGVKKTSLKPDELIESIYLPRPAKPARQLFRKVGTRAAQAISKTMAAGLLWLDKKGAVGELRFALGSMAPTVRRLRKAEQAVRGRKLDRETIDLAVKLLASDVSPIDDIRSTRLYRLRAAENIFRGFLEGRLEGV